MVHIQAFCQFQGFTLTRAVFLDAPSPHSVVFYNDGHGFQWSPIQQLFRYTWSWSLFHNVHVCKEEYGDQAFEKRLTVLLQNVAFVLCKTRKFAPYGPWEHTPKDMPHDTIDIDDQDCPASSRTSPRAGTNQEEEEGDL